MKAKQLCGGLALLASVGAVVACSGEASGPEPTGSVTERLEPGVYRLQSVASGMCAEVTGSAPNNGANIQLAECGDGDNQKWEFMSRPDGSFRIAALHSRKCMVALGKPAAEGNNVQQGRCIYKRSKWLVTEFDNEVVTLTSVKSSLCVGDNPNDWGYDLQQWNCTNTEDQQFRLSVQGTEPETGCLATGGTLSQAFCCAATPDFPNNCLTGACGCAPEYSRWVLGCDCPTGMCFDGTSCVLEQ